MSRNVNSKYWDEELETLPREELEQRQLKDLKEIVQFAYDHAPYYKRSFDEAGVKPYQVVVHPDGGLNTRSEHKSKRIVDERKLHDRT